MRGKGLVVRAALPARRITPAYAGKSRAVIGGGHALQDHPRVCGEKSGRVRPWRKHKGSPPRMRGKVIRCEELARVVGITPACAGKRGGMYHTRQSRGDHPRMCGEKC